MIVKHKASIQIKVRVVDPLLTSISDLASVNQIVFLVKTSIDATAVTILKKLTDVSTQIAVNTSTGIVTISLTQADLNITPGQYIWGLTLTYTNGNRYELTTKEGSFNNSLFIVEKEIVTEV